MNIRLTGVGLAHANGHVALNHVDLEVAEGERIAIIGPSGAGKTTLLQLLASSLRPSSGCLLLQNNDPWRLSRRARQRLRAQIGLIHQAPPLPPRQRVVTAVGAGRLGRWSLPRALLNLFYPLDTAGVQQALARLDIADKLFERCDQLSGGQLQRVGIARVLYQAPRLILADEPVSAIDPVLAQHTLATLNQVAQASGTTLLASLHAVDLALTNFPRVIGLRDGRILFDRPADRVSPDELKALYANEQLQPTTPLDIGKSEAEIRISRC